MENPKNFITAILYNAVVAKGSHEDVLDRRVPLTLYHIFAGYSIGASERDGPSIRVPTLMLRRGTEGGPRPIRIIFARLVPKSSVFVKAGVKLVAFDEVVHDLVKRSTSR